MVVEVMNRELNGCCGLVDVWWVGGLVGWQDDTELQYYAGWPRKNYPAQRRMWVLYISRTYWQQDSYLRNPLNRSLTVTSLEADKQAARHSLPTRKAVADRHVPLRSTIHTSRSGVAPGCPAPTSCCPASGAPCILARQSRVIRHSRIGYFCQLSRQQTWMDLDEILSQVLRSTM